MVALLVAPLWATSASADPTSPSGGFTFTVSSNDLTLTGCSDICPSDLVIPSSIGGDPVTSIAAGAFQFPLNSVIIPSSVRSIGDYAFQGDGLTSVSIASGVTSIGQNAFQDNSLNSIDIPSSVATIGDYAFENDGLTSATIAPGVTSIGQSAFQNDALTSIDIPSSVTSIGQFAFYSDGLSSATIASGVTSIGQYAFFGNSLSSLIIPSSVTSLGAGAFAGNVLTSVDIPSSITSVPSYAFETNELTSVDIPSSVTTLGVDAFAFNDLTSVTIPSSITSIGTFAFDENLLTSITFLGSAPSFGNEVFDGNPGGPAYYSPSTGGWNSVTPDEFDPFVLTVAPTPLVLTSTSGTYGSALPLTSSGGLGTGAVSYVVTASGTAGCLIIAGELHANFPGTCTVTVTKAADSEYPAQSSAATTVTFAPISQTNLTITSTSGVANAPLTLVTSGASGTGAISYTAVNGTATGCSVSGSTLIATSAGTCLVTANQAGDSNFSADSSPQTTITFALATPSVTWVAPTSIVYGTTLSATQLDATASVVGTFNYTPTFGTVLTVGSHTLSVTFVPTDSAAYSSATATVSISVTQATPGVPAIVNVPNSASVGGGFSAALSTVPSERSLPISGYASGAATDPLTNTIYFTNGGALLVLDGSTNRVIFQLGTGPDPDTVAVDPTTDMVYVVNEQGGSITVINGATNTPVTTIDVNGANPNDVAVDVATNTIYVANRNGDINVIDGATNTVTANIDTDRVSTALTSIRPPTPFTQLQFLRASSTS